MHQLRLARPQPHAAGSPPTRRAESRVGALVPSASSGRGCRSPPRGGGAGGRGRDLRWWATAGPRRVRVRGAPRGGPSAPGAAPLAEDQHPRSQEKGPGRVDTVTPKDVTLYVGVSVVTVTAARTPELPGRPELGPGSSAFSAGPRPCHWSPSGPPAGPGGRAWLIAPQRGAQQSTEDHMEPRKRLSNKLKYI